MKGSLAQETFDEPVGSGYDHKAYWSRTHQNAVPEYASKNYWLTIKQPPEERQPSYANILESAEGPKVSGPRGAVDLASKADKLQDMKSDVQDLRDELQRDRIAFSTELQRDRLAFREEMKGETAAISNKMDRLESGLEAKMTAMADRNHQDNRTTLWMVFSLLVAAIGIIVALHIDQRTETRRDMDKQWAEIKSIQQAQPAPQAPIIIQMPSSPAAPVPQPPAQEPKK